MNQLLAAAAVLSLCTPVWASLATFDEFPEGLIGQSFVSGGIKFFGARDGDNKAAPFYADDVSAATP